MTDHRPSVMRFDADYCWLRSTLEAVYNNALITDDYSYSETIVNCLLLLQFIIKIVMGSSSKICGGWFYWN